MGSTIIFTRRSHQKSIEDLIGLKQELGQLFKVFEGIDHQAFLIGGVGLALQNGEFYRDHKDFDVAVFAEELHIIARKIAEQGYKLVRRRFFTHLFSFLDLQIVSPFSANDIDQYSKKRLRLRFLKKGNSMRFINKRLDMIDIFLWKKEKGGVYSYAYDILIPWRGVEPTLKRNTSSGLVVPCIDNWSYFEPKSTAQQLDFEKAGIALDKVKE